MEPSISLWPGANDQSHYYQLNNANKLMPTTQTHEGFIQNKTVNQ